MRHTYNVKHLGKRRNGPSSSRRICNTCETPETTFACLAAVFPFFMVNIIQLLLEKMSTWLLHRKLGEQTSPLLNIAITNTRLTTQDWQSELQFHFTGLQHAKLETNQKLSPTDGTWNWHGWKKQFSLEIKWFVLLSHLGPWKKSFNITFPLKYVINLRKIES